jgi:hypothetical protein
MKRAYTVLTTALLACGGRAAAPMPALAGAARGGERAGAPPAALPMVRARAPLPMPACQAGDPQSLAALTDGVPAMSVLARGTRGALVAYLVDGNRDGEPELTLLALGADGRPQGPATTVTTGPRPAHPALVARGDGFVLAWREGAPGQEVVAVRALDERGAAVARQPAAPTIVPGWLGPPALAVAGEDVVLAYARSAERPEDPDARRGDAIEWARLGGARGSASAPEGGAFDATRAPVLAADTSRARLFAVTMRRGALPGDERALVEVALEGSFGLTLVARDLDNPTARAIEGGVLLGWRARVGARDVAARVLSLPASGEPSAPPLTVATFRGAFDAEVGFAPVGAGLLGAFTVSTLADDAGGTLNVSVLTDAGEYVGRQPLLVSSLVRNARVIGAGLGDDAWFLLEARADGGSGPVLGLASVRCDASHPVDRLEIPPPSLVQRLAPLDDPPARLAGATGVGRCTAAGAPVLFARHASGTPNAVAGTRAAAVSLPRGTVLFAVVREATGRPTRLVTSTVDARGALSPARGVLDDVVDVLATGAAGGRALAVVSVRRGEGEQAGVVFVAPDGRGNGFAPLPIARPTSAVVVPGAGTILVAGEREGAPGDAALFAVPWSGNRAGAPVVVAALRPGDTVLDATRGTRETIALLARPDALGEEVARALARVAIPDAPTEAARAAARVDPFADPLGYGRGDAFFVPGAAGPVVVYSEGAVVRAADLVQGELRNLRSVLGVHPTGGALLGRGQGAGETRWLALATGFPEDAGQRVSPITLAAIGPRGEVSTASAAIPDDAGALSERAAIAAEGGQVTLVYARAERDGTAAWMVARATCGAQAAGQGGGR